MRGGYVHNRVLLDPVRRLCRALNLPVQDEVPVVPGRDARHIDLVIGEGTYRVAVEAECSPKRVASDIDKARAVGVQELWIVVPSRAVKKQAEVVVRENKGAAGMRVCVFFVFEVGDRLRHCFPLYSSFPRAEGSLSGNGNHDRGGI